MIMKYKDFKMLSRDGIKKIVGGYEPVCDCQCGNVNGTKYHCYGTQGNCTDAASGGCIVNPGGPTCFEYCSAGGTTCWVY